MKRQFRAGAGKSKGIVRILIADNQAILVDGMRLLLEQHSHLKVVKVAADGSDAVHLARQLRPDVAILSIDMSGLNGIEAALQIRAVSPATRVLILTRHSSPEFICQALRAGVDGYLLKQCCGGKQVVDAVLEVSKGKSYVCARTSELLIGEIQGMVRRLTARERDVLRLTVEGRTVAKAASALKLPPTTIESYRSRVLRKLESHGLPGAELRGAYGASLARALCGCVP
jgi:DNA-binding NarL/FixJ family response regulator